MGSEPSQNGATPYTLHEAAQLLGVSLNTVRRKIARGELKATQAPRPQGHVWHVWLERTQDAAQHPPQGSTQDAANGYVQDAARLLPTDRAEQLVQVLTPLVEAATAPLRVELSEMRATLSQRDQELGAALERIRVLEIDRAEIASGSPAANAPDETTQKTSDTPPARPWWRLW